MPYHSATVCTVTGSPNEIDRFLSAHIAKAENGSDMFPFDTIIPRPECVDATEWSSTADAGFFALTGLIDDRFGFALNPMKVSAEHHGFNGDFFEYRAWLQETRPDAIAAGEAHLRCFRETGYRYWADWNIANWGTQCTGFNCEIRERAEGRAVLGIDSARWSPRRIFRKLAVMYANTIFSVISLCDRSLVYRAEFNGPNDFEIVVDVTDELLDEIFDRRPRSDRERGAATSRQS